MTFLVLKNTSLPVVCWHLKARSFKRNRQEKKGRHLYVPTRRDVAVEDSLWLCLLEFGVLLPLVIGPLILLLDVHIDELPKSFLALLLLVVAVVGQGITGLEESHDIVKITSSLIDVLTLVSRQDLHLHDLVACGIRDVGVLEHGENSALGYKPNLRIQRISTSHDEQYKT
jgi:hypothetical protein